MKEKYEISEEVDIIISDKGNIPIKFRTLKEKMNLNKAEENLLSDLIEEYIAKGKLVKIRDGKYSTPEAEGMVAGKFQANDKGFGFVITEDKDDKDIYIGSRYVKDAYNKDIVLCKIVKPSIDGKLPEGEIVRVLERGTDTVVGEYQEGKGFGFVVPDNGKNSSDIFVPGKVSKGAVSGEKVVVKIVKYVEGKNPEGEVIEIIGHKDDPGVDVLSIIKDYDVPTEFPAEVKDEVEKIESEVLEIDKAGRLDIRSWQTVTIDGEDTKDIDDAITLTKLDDGNYKLGVHIADVTHYVHENSSLDKEALERGTSIYVVDRVIPMLPHKLSNGICSLNQKVDRLALSCIMTINDKGKVIDYDIAETLINVDKRMSYTGVQKVTDKDPEALVEDKDFIEMIGHMGDLAKILFDKRIKRGALEFVTDECKIHLDENGKISEIKKYDRNDATKIIEEFMLVCNETVAEEYARADMPFVFRGHEEPDSEKLNYLSQFIKNFGYNLHLGEEIHAKSLQEILQQIEGKPEEKMISKILLRSMKQAKYVPTNDGHFGLAADYYCHFTSPIRRYPDLTIHRIIKENIKSGIFGKRYNELKSKTAEISEKTSVAERKADEIEREVEDYKKCEYMEQFVGDEFDGRISGVTNWGFFVELENTVEGLVRLSSLDDNYTFNETKYMLVGDKTGHIFVLGDAVKIKVEKVNLVNREIDFSFAGDETERNSFINTALAEESSEDKEDKE